MTATKIDGSAVSARIRAEVKTSIDKILATGARSPCIAVILVGEDPASQIYVGGKEKACASVGIKSESIRLARATPQAELLKVIERLNADPNVDAILLQLPVPQHINREVCVAAISPDKDVDGLTPMNQGRLVWKQEGLYPCTPLGIIELLKSYDVPLAGKVAAVLGRSILVGAPVATMLANAGATLINLHSMSVHPKQWTRQADIVVVATGVHRLVGKDWIKPGAAVIDVGIHRHDGKVSGDVAFDEVAAIAGALTPVPKGVGPMTIAMLLRNCLLAYERRQSASR